jgi:hypothetical protein
MCGLMTPRSLILGIFVACSVSTSATLLAQSAPTQPTSDPPAQTTQTRGLFPEPRLLRKGIELTGRYTADDETGETEKKNGLYPELGNMVTGAGWISAGVGYRHHFFGDRAVIDASTGISWRAYKMAQLRIELTPFADERISVGVQTRWQDLTQIRYFGEGPDSLEADRSHYRLKSTNTVGYVTFRPQTWLAVEGRLGWLGNPKLLPAGGAFKPDYPDTASVFSDDPVYQLTTQPDFVHGEIAVIADTRDEPGYPSRGGVYRAAVSRYADQDANNFSFGRYEVEAAHFLPIVNENVVFAIRGWVAGSTTDDGKHVPFYLAPSLGGSTTLRGYNDYRFHDRNLALINTELRVAVFEHVDAVALFEAGNVAPRFGDLNFDKTSFGVGFRVHTDTATLARFDVARSEEGWKVMFRMNEPFRMSRFKKRTAQVPFAP